MKLYRNIPVECVSILELLSLLATDPVSQNKPVYLLFRISLGKLGIKSLSSFSYHNKAHLRKNKAYNNLN